MVNFKVEISKLIAQQVADLTVPLLAEAKWGASWFDAK